MKTLLKYIYIFILPALIISCTKESNTLKEDENFKIGITMKSNIGGSSDNVTFNTVRVIATRQNGLIVYNTLYNNVGDEISTNLDRKSVW